MVRMSRVMGKERRELTMTRHRETHHLRGEVQKLWSVKEEHIRWCITVSGCMKNGTCVLCESTKKMTRKRHTEKNA